ncbi:hypothetical protein O9G_003600 [Rozella allomycis CSF55]|uniref:Uncharacterized protein n=1 Tax=Rozella allomycis (strain CSF55) TaxID=988480 RepID=A0A075AT35_ROZAC|nr:hypothetical protein O9G_003600 [Rozella allomycis CSF55]|eukprot:EPZ31890.1 hypothetical protein O9G_003600 [Rozella allomycis CSF55]
MTVQTKLCNGEVVDAEIQPLEVFLVPWRNVDMKFCKTLKQKHFEHPNRYAKVSIAHPLEVFLVPWRNVDMKFCKTLNQKHSEHPNRYAKVYIAHVIL